MTIKERKKLLNEKYKNVLSYPISSYRLRDWYHSGLGTGHGKGVKYNTTYHTAIKNYDGALSLDIQANSLEELELLIKKYS